MKITIIKKTNGNAQKISQCPWMIDEPPVAKS
jgi:hypothetical protein